MAGFFLVLEFQTTVNCLVLMLIVLPNQSSNLLGLLLSLLWITAASLSVILSGVQNSYLNLVAPLFSRGKPTLCHYQTSWYAGVPFLAPAA